MARGCNRNGWLLLILMIFGMIIGGFLGELLGKYVPILKFGYSFGVQPHTWNLIMLKLTFGISLNINMFGILGIILAIYAYKKM